MTEDEIARLQVSQDQRWRDQMTGYTPEQQKKVADFIAKNATRWALPTSGNLALDDYKRSREAYVKAARGGITGFTPAAEGTGWGENYMPGVGGNEPIYGNMVGNENLWDKDWASSLTPQQAAEFRRLSEAHDDKIQGRMKLAALASLGAIAGAGALGAGMLGSGGAGAGALGGAAAEAGTGGGMLGGLSGSAAGLTDALGIGSGLGMEGFGSGLGLTVGGDLGGGLSGAAAGLSGGGALSGLGDIFGGLGNFGGAAGLSGGGALSGLGDIFGGLGNFGGAGGGSILDTIKDVVGDKLGSGSPPPQSGGGMDWSRLLQGMGLGSAGLAAIQALRNNMPMPAVPDYLKLAQQTADSANQAVERQTLANRPNQTNAFGDTSTWNKDPSGQWNQTVNLSDANQKRMQEQQAMMAALRGQISNQIQNPAQMPAMRGMPTNLPNVRLGALNKNLPAMGVLGGM